MNTQQGAPNIIDSIHPDFYQPDKYYLGVDIGKGTQTIVTKLFYKNTSYVIFEVNYSGRVQYITVDDEKYNTKAISTELARLAFWLHDSFATKNQGSQPLTQGLRKESSLLDPINETLADCIALCFQGHEKEAKTLMDQLLLEVKNEVFKWS